MSALKILTTPLDWSELEALAVPAPPEPGGLGHPTAGSPSTSEDRVQGSTNAQSLLRLFGQAEGEVRVTLYRDHHAWCPYCQKVWLWLEERRVPYRVRKVTMVCYGSKEAWYQQRVPSGMLPALELDGRLITESDRILEALEGAFGPLGAGMNEAEVLALRRLERQLFRSWCRWLCFPFRSADEESAARDSFRRLAEAMESALGATAGPFLLGHQPATADLVFVPFLERMSASLAYYKGYLLRKEHDLLSRWFEALELRSTYRGTQSDFHTHSHDLPPQMGGCCPSGTPEQRALASRIDAGPWPILGAGEEDPETSQPEPPESARIALARVIRHRLPLLARRAGLDDRFDQALRCALTHLATGQACPPPAASAASLRHLRDRVCVPRDMPLHAGRRLRASLEFTAGLDPVAPEAQGEPLATRHRRDQDPAAFVSGPFFGGQGGEPS